MQALKKIHYLLFLAVFMLAAKPFVGFSALKQSDNASASHIIVKAFTKRKQEYTEDSAYDVSVIQKRLANPLLALTVLFFFILDSLFSSANRQRKLVTAGILSDIHAGLPLPLPRYLLSGTLLI